MALTTQERRFTEKVLAYANTLTDIYNDLAILRARWDQNDLANAITDADLLEQPELSHLTAAKLVDAITALDAVRTALGDTTSGHIVNLIKVLP